jgi:hypothetical protein
MWICRYYTLNQKEVNFSLTNIYNKQINKYLYERLSRHAFLLVKQGISVFRLKMAL